MSSHDRDTILKDKLEIAANVRMTHPRAYEAPGPSGLPMNHQSPRDIKKKIKGSIFFCSTCRKAEPKDIPFKVCSSCQAVFYCSRECQKYDWPNHKQSCHGYQREKRLEKLANTLTSNIGLIGFIQIAILLRFNLLDPGALEEPFSALVPLVIEPEDIVNFARLRGEIGPEIPVDHREKIKGMVQVSNVLECPERFLSKQDLYKFWKAYLANAASEGHRRPPGPFGILVFMVGDAIAFLQFPFFISPGFVKMARECEEQPFTQLMTGGGQYKTRSVPTNYSSCIEYVNSSIRLDKANRFLLRADMTAADEQLILDTVQIANPVGDHIYGLGNLKVKINTEYIYQVLVESEDSDTTTGHDQIEQ